MTNRSGPFLQNAWRCVMVLFLTWLLFNLATTAEYVIHDYSPIPIADYWRVPQLWPEYRTLHFSHLWAQHNEHRILFPELIFIVDMALFHGHTYLPIGLSALCWCGVWGVLVQAAYSQTSIPSPVREAALLLAGTVLAWYGCSSVIATPFLIVFTLLQFLVLISIFYLAKAVETGLSRNLAVSIAAAAAGTYTCGNGMMVWPVLLAGAFYLKLSRRHVVALAASAVLFIGIYFIGYHFQPSSMMSNLTHPVQALEFLCSYMSMPFGSDRVASFGIQVGAANILLMAAWFLFAWRRGLLKSQLGTVLSGGYLFTFLSALLTTSARMELDDLPFNQAKAWRYVTLPTLCWAILTVALIWAFSQLAPRYGSLATTVVLAALYAYGFNKARQWPDETRLDFQNAQVTATMLRNGLFEGNQIRTIFPDPEFVRTHSEILRQDRKSIWARGVDKWIGQDVRHLMPGNTPVAGQVTRVYPVPGGLQLFGWADTDSLTDDHEVLFVNAESSVIEGFGRRPAAGMPSDLSAWDTPKELSFVGYVSRRKPSENLLVYVKTSKGQSWRPLAGIIHVPSFSLLERSADTPEIAPFTWQTDANWKQPGYPPPLLAASNGPMPSHVLGSWSASDAKKGSIRSLPFTVPVDHCLVQPVLHGVSTYGLSVQVRDADTQQTIVSLPMLDGRSIWERWRIPILDTTKSLIIVGDDEGSGPNEWVAIGVPEQCP